MPYHTVSYHIIGLVCDTVRPVVSYSAIPVHSIKLFLLDTQYHTILYHIMPCHDIYHTYLNNFFAILITRSFAWYHFVFRLLYCTVLYCTLSYLIFSSLLFSFILSIFVALRTPFSNLESYWIDVRTIRNFIFFFFFFFFLTLKSWSILIQCGRNTL